MLAVLFPGQTSWNNNAQRNTNMGSSTSKKRSPHLDDVLLWTVFVKKQKWSLATLPLSLQKGTLVTQKTGKTTVRGTLVKTTSQRSTKFKVNVKNDVQFNRFNDIYIGTFKISKEQLIQTVSWRYPRLTSQSHLTHKEMYPPPPPRETTIDLQDSTVTSYTAMDLADCKHTRRSKNLHTILQVELDNRNHAHKTSVTSAHVDSLHHQKKLNAVKKFFGNDRKLFYISNQELERVIDDAGIGHLEYTQTLGIEGIPMNKKQRKRQPKLGSKEQFLATQLLLAEVFQVMTLHVHVLSIREGLETVENPPPKKLSLCQRLMRFRKKRVKLRRSEVEYMISTHSGPPSIKLETQQRLLVKVGQRAQDNSDGDSSSGSSSGSDSSSGSGSGSDEEGGGGPRRLGSDFTDDSDRFDAETESDEESSQESKDGENGDPSSHVEVQYTDGGDFAHVLVDPIGDLVGLLDQDVENPAIIVAHEPVRQVIIPTDGFMSRKAALLDAFGSYLTKKEEMDKFERRVLRKGTLNMKMLPPSPTKRSGKKHRKGKKKKGGGGGGGGGKYAVKALDFEEGDADAEDDTGVDHGLTTAVDAVGNDMKEDGAIEGKPGKVGPEIDE